MMSILFCWRTTSKTTERNSVLLTVRKCFGGMTFGLGSYLQGPQASRIQERIPYWCTFIKVGSTSGIHFSSASEDPCAWERSSHGRGRRGGDIVRNRWISSASIRESAASVSLLSLSRRLLVVWIEMMDGKPYTLRECRFPLLLPRLFISTVHWTPRSS